MSVTFNPFTGNFDFVGEEPYNYYNVPANDVVFVPINTEHHVTDNLTLIGDMIVEGRLVVRSRANVIQGPATSTDNAIARYDMTTGLLLLDSLVTIADDGGLFTPGNILTLGAVTIGDAEDEMTIHGIQETTNFFAHATEDKSIILGESHSNTSGKGAHIHLGRTRGTTEATEAVVQNGDNLLGLGGLGFDGVDFEFGGYIHLDVEDPTPGPTSMGSRWDIATTPQNEISSVIALSIHQDQLVEFKAGVAGHGKVITNTDSPYTVLPTDNILEIDAVDGNVLVNLPPLADKAYRRLEFCRIDNSANTVTLDGNGSETILGETDQTLRQWDLAILRAGSTSWI